MKQLAHWGHRSFVLTNSKKHTTNRNMQLTLPTFVPGQSDPSASGPSGQSIRKGHYDLKPCGPYSTKILISRNPHNTTQAVIFQDNKSYWLRLSQDSEVRPLMYVDDQNRISLWRPSAANDQLLNKYDTYIYPSTCLVLTNFNPQLWTAQGVLGGGRPLTSNDKLPSGYSLKSDSRGMQVVTNQG
jgi:hypothetical protein